MNQQAHSNRDLTKKELIKILEKIDSEQSVQMTRESRSGQDEGED